MEKGDLKISENTVVVNCTTKELAEQVLEVMKFKNNVLEHKEIVVDGVWDEFGDSLCFREYGKRIIYDGINFYKENYKNVPIISAEEFLNRHQHILENNFPIKEIEAESEIKEDDAAKIQINNMEEIDIKINENIAVNCTTKELAEQVLEVMYKRGSALKNQNFNLDYACKIHGDLLCFRACSNDIKYSNTDYFENVLNLPIISAEEYLKKVKEPIIQFKSNPLEQVIEKATKTVISAVNDCVNQEFESVKPEKPKSILLEAALILNGDRQADYGDAVDNFRHIASVVNAALRREDITPDLCCMVHIATKLCREGNRHKRDNLVDLAAYSEILNQIKESKEANEQD